MSEDTVPYGNSESEVAALRLRLHHAEAQRDAFKAALSKAVMSVLAEAVDVQKEVNAAWSRAKADAELTNLQSEADRLKAEKERLLQQVMHMEATWPRDPHHGGKVYQMPVEQFTDTSPTFVNVDPLLREAIASARLAQREGGAS